MPSNSPNLVQELVQSYKKISKGWNACMGRISGSGQWDSNPRHSPWEGDVLPLNYTRAN